MFTEQSFNERAVIVLNELTGCDKRKQKRKEQAAETRENLLQSARKLFAKNGYAATPVRKINREIGMADGILYHYFPDGKREILEVLVKESLEKTLSENEAWASELENLPLEDILKRIAEMADDFFNENIELLMILFKESSIIELGEMKQLVAMFEEKRNDVALLLKAKHEQGEIKKIDFYISADILSSVMIEGLIEKISGVPVSIASTKEGRERVIDYIVNLWKNDGE